MVKVFASKDKWHALIIVPKLQTKWLLKVGDGLVELQCLGTKFSLEVEAPPNLTDDDFTRLVENVAQQLFAYDDDEIVLVYTETSLKFAVENLSDDDDYDYDDELL